MHGVTNLLSNCCIGLLSILPNKSPQQDSFLTHLHLISASWPSKSLRPKHMKQFFHDSLQLVLPTLFALLENPPNFPWPKKQPLRLSHMEAAIMLFDSIYVFYQFAYTPNPTQEDFLMLHIARTAILSVHAAYKWFVAPTTHYLLTHGILDAETDKTAYNTLQEGVEHVNQEIKAENKVTFISKEAEHISESSYMHIINQQLLRLILIQLGHSSTSTNKYTLINALTYCTPPLPPTSEINKPKYTYYYLQLLRRWKI